MTASERTGTAPVQTGTPGPNGQVPQGPRTAQRRRRWRLIGGAAAVLVLLLAGAAIWRQTAGAPPPPTPTPTPGPRYQAQGVVRPLAEARIGSAGGGVVASLNVREGDTLTSRQELARVSGPNGTEVIVAPWAGTVTGVLVTRGDTVAPGATVATLADLSRLRVETTDVDEYLIAQVRQGQPVAVRVEALDQRVLQGYVRSAALVPRPAPSGGQHYPVVIDLAELPPELRSGMTVRVAFDEPSTETPATTPAQGTATPGS
jgi:multidrug efflux pump subunit AcrA (membrane-fusion protein)